MRIERLRRGLELLNKVDGKKYKVVEVDGAAGTAVEMHTDLDGTLIGLGDEEVTITEKNALAFRIINDPEPYPVPEGYSVEGGVLLKDGKLACIQGEFSFGKILAKCEDYLILTAKVKGMKDGDVILVSYQVSRDFFRKLTVVPTENIVFLGYAGEGMETAVFIFSATEEKEDCVDGEKKTVRCFKERPWSSLQKAGPVLTRTSMALSLSMTASSSRFRAAETGTLTCSWRPTRMKRTGCWYRARNVCGPSCTAGTCAVSVDSAATGTSGQAGALLTAIS